MDLSEEAPAVLSVLVSAGWVAAGVDTAVPAPTSETAGEDAVGDGDSSLTTFLGADEVKVTEGLSPLGVVGSYAKCAMRNSQARYHAKNE